MTATWLKTSSEAKAVCLLWMEQGNRARWLNVNKATFIITYRELLYRPLQPRRPPCIPCISHEDLSKGIQSTVQRTPVLTWSAELPSELHCLQRLSQKNAAYTNIQDDCHFKWQGNAHLWDTCRKNLQGRKIGLVRDRNKTGNIQTVEHTVFNVIAATNVHSWLI